VKQTIMRLAAPVCAAIIISATQVHAQQFPLLAVGTLVESRAGALADVSGLTYTLENGVPANNLGGLGSAITYAGGNEFLALPDRGPNAVPFNSAVDDTVAYVNRFHTVHLNLTPNHSGSGLPFELKPLLQQTTLLWSATPLVYGSVNGSGVPPINGLMRYYFTGRSDALTHRKIPGIQTTRVSTRKAFAFRTTERASSSPTNTVRISTSSIAAPVCG